jgi:hypothetical protein
VLAELFDRLHVNERSAKQPEAHDLIIAISAMTKLFAEVHVVVDGLDECGEGTREACGWLGQLLCADDTHISFALLSRDEADIRDVFGPVCAYIEVAAHTQDVEHYVLTEIEARTKAKTLRIRSLDLKDLIVKQLVERTEGS